MNDRRTDHEEFFTNPERVLLTIGRGRLALSGRGRGAGSSVNRRSYYLTPLHLAEHRSVREAQACRPSIRPFDVPVGRGENLQNAPTFESFEVRW